MSANSRNSARVVLESSDISRALSRIAHEILENNKGSKDLVLLGIPSRGVPLANRIAQKINEFEKVNIPVGSLDIWFLGVLVAAVQSAWHQRRSQMRSRHWLLSRTLHHHL